MNRSQLPPARGGPARQVRVALTAVRGRTQLEDALVLHGEGESVAVLRVRCLNAMARQDVTGMHIVPPFPSRPIALLNICAPDSHIWYEAAHSDWLHETDPKPFEIPVRFDFFERIQQMEVCLLDLEDGSGTAKLQVRQRPARCVPSCVCKLAALLVKRLSGLVKRFSGLVKRRRRRQVSVMYTPPETLPRDFVAGAAHRPESPARAPSQQTAAGCHSAVRSNEPLRSLGV